MTFKPLKQGSQIDCKPYIEKCIEDIHSWMEVNMIKLNDDKTEFIIFGTCQQLAKVSDLNIKIGSDIIPPVEHVRNLGYQMDSYLLNTQYINKLVSTLLWTLCDINTVRSRIDQDTAKIVIQGLVLSKSNYCNSLVIGSPGYHLDKLQCIKNMACRIIHNI